VGAKRVEIEVKYDRHYQPIKEGYEYVRIHDWEKRTWVHLQIFQYPCYLVCDVPKHKYKDLSSGKEKVETHMVPWTRSGFSLLFEGKVLEDLKRTGQGSQTATGFGIYPSVVWRIFHHYYKYNCWLLEDCSEVVHLGYDESSRQKGQSYNANITYDKFHVSQLVNKAFDKVRKHIAKRHHTSFNKWVFLKKSSPLKNKHSKIVYWILIRF
jgi:transposase